MMQKHKKQCVLHVTTVPPSLRFAMGHMNYAREHGMDVHAMSSPGEALDAFARETQIEVHAVEMSRRITPMRDLASLGRIIRVIKNIRPTIVHAYTPKGGLLAMLAARWCNVPVRIYHILGLPMMTARGMKRRLLRSTERMSCRLAHQVYSMCDSLSEVVVGEGICPAQKLKVLHRGGVDGIEAMDRFNPTRLPEETSRLIRQRHNIPPDATVAGYVGRIVRDKGLIELSQAWRVLREEFPSLHLLVAGPIESEDPLPADVLASLQSDPRVHLAGPIRDMPSLYRALDFLVLPTYREGFGVVLVEAAAMEVPAIATRIPGCVDAVRDGETGVLVPPRDAGALASAMRAYVNDASLRRRHGEQGRQRVLRDFDPDMMRATLFQDYQRLLREQGCSV